ncbi:MAG: hypothetical protein AB8I08_39140 [Sandaracinaceae bacterium]
MPLALVVEPDPRDRTLHATVLRRIPGISVIAMTTVREALESAAIEAPSVVLTASDLEDGDALSLLRALRRVCKPACFIVLEERRGEAGDLPRDASVHRIGRPVEARRVRKLVQSSTRATLDRQPLFKPAEYIQLLCIGGHSAAVQCFESERPLGEILVREGAVWSAHDAEGEGEKALQRLLAHDKAAAMARPLGANLTERTIQRRWEIVLLEAAQQQDESRRDQTQLESKVDAHLKAASNAVLRGELQRAADEFAAAAVIAPEDPVIRHNVARLERLGYDGSKEQNGD